MTQSITLGNWKLNPASGEYESGYDGVPTDSVVISGSGFGAKTAQQPQFFELFSGANAQLVKDYNPSWVGYESSIGAVITSLNSRYSGHLSAYNDPDRGSDFYTNHRSFTPSDKVFLSMYVRVHSPRGVSFSGGVTKFQRLNSTVSSGGGGVYNGVGNCTLGGASPDNWFSAWTGSEGELNNLGYLTTSWYPINQWRRIEYEVKLNTVDVANGFFNVHVDRYGSKLSGNIMQRKTGFSSSNWLLDSTLLGLESPNQEKYYTPNTLLANTDYTVTWNGIPYTYNSPTVPTASDIVNGLSSLLTAAGRVNKVYSNQSLYVDFGATVTYTSNFTKEPSYGMQVSEVYLDIDFKRIYVGNANTWGACTETNPQPYTFWNDTNITIKPYVGAISGNKYLYKQLTENTTPILIGELLGNSISGWSIVYV
jgi:hypothetical protein